jgi:hypothetical protein
MFFNDFRHRRPMPFFFSRDLADIFPGDELLFDSGPLWERNCRSWKEVLIPFLNPRFFGTKTLEEGAVVVCYYPAISARQNGPQRAPEVSRQLPELRNSGAKGKFRRAIA